MPRRPVAPVATADFRAQLEAARLDLRALFRALDQLQLTQDVPDELSHLFELDADFAEALWVLDQPPGRFDLAAMAADTVASLAEMPEARAELEGLLARRKRTQLGAQVSAVRATLLPEDAYLDVPGRDPAAE